jgi:hypothetical protein
LILNTSGIGKSGDFSYIPEEILNKKYSSSFDKIFLFEASRGKPIELKKYA